MSVSTPEHLIDKILNIWNVPPAARLMLARCGLTKEAAARAIHHAIDAAQTQLWPARAHP